MLNAVTTSLSGLMAAQKTLETASRNVANASTEGYRARTVALTEAAGGGVQAAEGLPSGADPAAPGLSNVDLVREMGDLVLAKPLYGANLKALQAQDEMTGALLDVVR